MKRVAQLDPNGCGVACVAMLAGVSYRSACALMFPDKRGNYTSHAQLRKALRRYGIGLGKRVSLSGQRLNDLTVDGILSARIFWKGDDWSHWIVWDARRQALLDPYDEQISLRLTRLVGFYPASR